MVRESWLIPTLAAQDRQDIGAVLPTTPMKIIILTLALAQSRRLSEKDSGFKQGTPLKWAGESIRHLSPESCLTPLKNRL